jgi:long-chain acyl-CoA synthetase
MLPKPRTLLGDTERLALSQRTDLGCGNFLHVAVEVNPNRDEQFIWMDKPCTTFRGETFSGFSLSELKRVADSYAAWYYGNGIRERDPVAVYIDEGIKNLIHYVALTGIGAIPILINGNMRPETAAGFVKKSGAIALYTDRNHEAAIAAHLDAWTFKFIATDDVAVHMGKPELPGYYPFAHSPKDTVLVGHSSGTTGIPKAVIFGHEQFFYGPRFRLTLPFPKASERVLSALPHSHSAGIAYIMLAILNGGSTMILSNNKPSTVIPAIEQFKPSMFIAFPETYVELCQENFADHDFSSIHAWVNGGDAAHETHIRKLISVGTREKNGQTTTGSIFIDGLGSSEMGFSLFRMVHTPETELYHRCIGTALDWVDAVVLGEHGEKLPPYRIGKLGVKSPTITPGYWNDSVLTMRSQVNGYWLTGDLFYHDEQGRFFHVDRIPDAIKTADGVFYSLQNEELLMRHFPELADCTIIGVPEDDTYSVPVALVRLKAGVAVDLKALKEKINVLLKAEKKLPLKLVLQADPKSIPLGPTGKVLKRELRDQYRLLFADKTPFSNKKVSKQWAPTNVSA